MLVGAHPGYISWDEYQENQRRLQENAHALGPERRKSPPREGPALLQGLVICGNCGERMKVIYHVRAGRRVPDYICDGRTVNDPQPMCQWISGKDVDEAVGEPAPGNRNSSSHRSDARRATRIASPIAVPPPFSACALAPCARIRHSAQYDRHCEASGRGCCRRWWRRRSARANGPLASAK